MKKPINLGDSSKFVSYKTNGITNCLDLCKMILNNYGLTYYGYDDWYMPNYNELNAMYAQRDSIGGFGNDPYWTNVDGDMAYCIHFSWSGGTGNYEKSRENNVRCIRKN